MLQIAVCVKQVPEGQVEMDRKSGHLNRGESSRCMNMYDYAAVETALRISEQVSACIDVFTMGPESAKQVLRDAIALGADNGILLSDKAFSGADVLATAYTLSQGMEKRKSYDLILCGKQTTDGDTAQVAGSIAGQRKIPYLPWVNQIVSVTESAISVTSVMDCNTVEYETNYPCLLSVEPGIYTVRIPTLKNRMASRKARIQVWDNMVLKMEPDRIGQKGSATKVVKLELQKRKELRQVLNIDADEALLLIKREIG